MLPHGVNCLLLTKLEISAKIAGCFKNMKKKMKRGIVLACSGILLLVGIIGVIAPIIPGIPFLILGVSILGIDTPQLIKKYIS